VDERNAKIFVMSDYLKELSSEFSENLKLNYDLKKKNWFNIGGQNKDLL